MRTIGHVHETAISNYVSQVQAGLPMECGSHPSCPTNLVILEGQGAESGNTLEILMIQFKMKAWNGENNQATKQLPYIGR